MTATKAEIENDEQNALQVARIKVQQPSDVKKTSPKRKTNTMATKATKSTRAPSSSPRSSRAPKSVKQPNTLGAKIVAYLKRVETASTEQIAKTCRVPMGQAFSRLWWMANRDGILVVKGKGSEAEWRLTKAYATQLAAS